MRHRILEIAVVSSSRGVSVPPSGWIAGQLWCCRGLDADGEGWVVVWWGRPLSREGRGIGGGSVTQSDFVSVGREGGYFVIMRVP